MCKQSENIGELAEALAAFQGTIGNPVRNRTVKVKGETRDGKGFSYDFRYTTFDAIVDTVRGPLSENGLSFAQSLEVQEGKPVLTTTLMHKSGNWIKSTIPVVQEKPGLQALGSAITYAKRYSLSAMLGIASDEDDDGNSAEGNHVAESTEKPRTVQTARGKSADGKTPVPVHQAKDAKGKSVTDWLRFCNDAKAEIEACATPEDVNGFVVRNNAAMQNLAKANRVYFDDLKAAKDDRLARVSQAPVKEAAE